MKLAVLCKSNDIGRNFLERALRHGYAVKALVPAGTELSLPHKNLSVVTGATDDANFITSELNSAHAVVALPGAISDTHALNIVISAMQAHGIVRFIVATESFTGFGQPQGFADLLKQAHIDWTVVHVAADQDPAPAGFRVSGVDFTKYLVSQITDVTHIGAAVLLRN